MNHAMSHQEAERRNRLLWDELADVHLESYKEIVMLRAGDEVLDEIELRELGDVSGRSMLHLQCHIGSDTLAWARHGAVMTGVDFSEKSLACAQLLFDELGQQATFVHSNVFEVRDVLKGKFDIVYTSKGVLCWLKDLPEWGRIIAHYLKPGGTFYLMETHPYAAALEEHEGQITFDYPYFHQRAPMEWSSDDPDYADENYVPSNPSFEWQWSVSDILHALLDAGLKIELVGEYDRLFFKMLPSMTSEDGRWFKLPGYETKIPLLLTVRARKPA